MKPALRTTTQQHSTDLSSYFFPTRLCLLRADPWPCSSFFRLILAVIRRCIFPGELYYHFVDTGKREAFYSNLSHTDLIFLTQITTMV